MGDPELGTRIREARQAMGLTQQEFAALVGWKDSQSVSNAERGITGVPPERIRAISVATGRPISYFMDARPEPPPVDVAARLDEIHGMLVDLQTNAGPPLLIDQLESLVRRLEAGTVAISPEGLAETERQLRMLAAAILEAAEALAQRQHAATGAP